MSKNEDKTTNEKMRIENLLNPLNSPSNLRNIGVELDQDLEEIQKIPFDKAFLDEFLKSVSNTPTPTPTATPTATPIATATENPTSSPENCPNLPFNLSNPSLSSTSNFSRSPLSRNSSNASNLSLNSRSPS
jgi:hypothetical protein